MGYRIILGKGFGLQIRRVILTTNIYGQICGHTDHIEYRNMVEQIIFLSNSRLLYR